MSENWTDVGSAEELSQNWVFTFHRFLMLPIRAAGRQKTWKTIPLPSRPQENCMEVQRIWHAAPLNLQTGCW